MSLTSLSRPVTFWQGVQALLIDLVGIVGLLLAAASPLALFYVGVKGHAWWSAIMAQVSPVVQWAYVGAFAVSALGCCAMGFKTSHPTHTGAWWTAMLVLWCLGCYTQVCIWTS